MSNTTYSIEVTQCVTAPIIDRFEITLDDKLNSYEQQRLIHIEMRRRLKQL